MKDLLTHKEKIPRVLHTYSRAWTHARTHERGHTTDLTLQLLTSDTAVLSHSSELLLKAFSLLL